MPSPSSDREHAPTATVSWSAEDSTASPSLSGSFLDGTCQPIIEGGFSSSDSGAPLSISIPRQAKWLEVDAQSVVPWPSNITVTIQSHGKKCRRR